MMIRTQKILHSAVLPLMRLLLLLPLVAAVCAVIATPAFAQELSDRGEKIYVKGTIGEVSWVNLCKNTTEAKGVVLDKCEDEEMGYGGVIGYRFNPYLGMEAGGHYAEGFETESGRGQAAFKQEREYLGYTLGGTAYVPIIGTHGVVVLSGRSGLHYWSTEVDNKPNGPTSLTRDETVTNESTDFYYGGGLEFRFSEHFSMSAQYTRYVAEGDNSLDFLSGNVIFSF